MLMKRNREEEPKLGERGVAESVSKSFLAYKKTAINSAEVNLREGS